MVSLEYISDFLTPSGIKVDSIDELLLWNIMQGATSAYKLYSIGKDENKKPSLAYKNVHRRIRRIHEAGLIEEITKQGGYKHGAINYRLTSRGLMYLFSELMTPKNIHEIMLKYSQNTLFKFFVYGFFEKQTLTQSTRTLEFLLQDYIEEGCQKIRLFVDSSLVENYNAYGDEGYLEPGNSLKDILNHQLEWHKRSFILKVATMKGELLSWRVNKTNDREQTLDLLANDKKFMNALEEYGGELREGYETLITLRSKHGKR